MRTPPPPCAILEPLTVVVVAVTVLFTLAGTAARKMSRRQELLEDASTDIKRARLEIGETAAAGRRALLITLMTSVFLFLANALLTVVLSRADNGDNMPTSGTVTTDTPIRYRPDARSRRG